MEIASHLIQWLYAMMKVYDEMIARQMLSIASNQFYVFLNVVVKSVCPVLKSSRDLLRLAQFQLKFTRMLLKLARMLVKLTRVLLKLAGVLLKLPQHVQGQLVLPMLELAQLV